MMMATKNARMNCPGILDCGPLANSNSDITKGYTPFVSHGTVCLEVGEKVPIYILRDTGAAQSLILDSMYLAVLSEILNRYQCIASRGRVGSNQCTTPYCLLTLRFGFRTCDSWIKTLPSSEGHIVNFGE